MRTYLVVVDDTPEAVVALRFAARRAAKTGGTVEILALIPPVEFLGLSDVQATIEEEARQHVEALVASAAGILTEEAGIRPSIRVATGDPVALVRRALRDNAQIAALVLGASASGSAGPLVAHFTGTELGTLPCPLMIVPGDLSTEALGRLS